MDAFSSMLDSTPELLAAAAERIRSYLLDLERGHLDDEPIVRLKSKIEEIQKASIQVKHDRESERRGERSTHCWTPRDVECFRNVRSITDAIIKRTYEDIIGPLRRRLSENPRFDHVGVKGLRLSADDQEYFDDASLILQHQSQTLGILHDAFSYAFAVKDFNPKGKHTPRALDLAERLQSQAIDLQKYINQIPKDCREKMAGDIQRLAGTLDAVNSLGRPWPSRRNQHFYIDRDPDTKFIGREDEYESVHKAFFTSSRAFQRRFVIHGAPGSGKSALAHQFAIRERSNYWGIFWVDASTYESANESLRKVAQIDGVQSQDFSAAKRWLSTRDASFEWLLIIDNADVDDKWIQTIFPAGDRGSIILTTRNPHHVIHGTVGHLPLTRMTMDDATMLLLRTANIPEPWMDSDRSHAVSICRYLKCLPLAIVQAGNAIFQGLCHIGGYVDFVENTIRRLRRQWDRLRQHSSRLPDDIFAENQDAESIFGTYEILYKSLETAATTRSSTNQRIANTCSDALEILHVFSYMHHENIRLDVLVSASVLPVEEEKEAAIIQKKEDIVVRRLGIRPQRTWRAALQEAALRASNRLELRPVLPEVLKNPDALDADDLRSEVYNLLRKSLHQLEVRGLVTKFEGETNHRGSASSQEARYYMHPMAHRWVRVRKFSAAEDGLFCQMAKTILSRAVRLEGTDGPNEQGMRRELRPHVDHVRNHDLVVRRLIQDRREKGRRMWSLSFIFSTLWPDLTTAYYGQTQALEDAKFSKVYMESGNFPEATRLLRQVNAFVLGRLGADHEKTHMAQLGLAASLTHQTFHNEAESLQRQVYASRRLTLGAEHPKTLEIMRDLGTNVLGQSFVAESLRLIETARDGLARAYGQSHLQTLKCESHLGRVHYFRLDAEEACRHHERAYRGAKSTKDAIPEEDFLSFQQDYALALARAGKDLELAESLQKDVLARRLKGWGEANQWTLFSKGVYGIILAGLKRYEEAENLMRDALDLGLSTMEENHLGLLAGKQWLAQVLMDKGDLAEAEGYLRQVTPKALYREASDNHGENKDRIMAVWMLVQCLEKQQKLDEALTFCKEIQVSFLELGDKRLVSKHKLYGMISEKTKALEGRVRTMGKSASPQEEALETGTTAVV